MIRGAALRTEAEMERWCSVAELGRLAVIFQPSSKTSHSQTFFSTGLDYKACTWSRDYLPIVPKIAVRQTVGGCGAAEGNLKPCRPFSPTQ